MVESVTQSLFNKTHRSPHRMLYTLDLQCTYCSCVLVNAAWQGVVGATINDIMYGIPRYLTSYIAAYMSCINYQKTLFFLCIFLSFALVIFIYLQICRSHNFPMALCILSSCINFTFEMLLILLKLCCS